MRTGEEGGLALVHLGDLAGLGQVGDHHRERLVHPVLAAAQLLDRRGRGGVARQVVAAQSLDRHDLAALPSARWAAAQVRAVTGSRAPFLR